MTEITPLDKHIFRICTRDELTFDDVISVEVVSVRRLKLAVKQLKEETESTDYNANEYDDGNETHKIIDKIFGELAK